MITQRVTPGNDARGGRRFIRLPVSLPVIGWLPDRSGLELRGIALRVGAGGIEVEFSQAIPPGSTLQVVLKTQRDPIEAGCRVVFARSSREEILQHRATCGSPSQRSPKPHA